MKNKYWANNRGSSFLKVLIIFTSIAIVIGLGIGIAFIVDSIKADKKNNFGEFEIYLNDEGTRVEDNDAFIELKQIKIGEKIDLKAKMNINVDCLPMYDEETNEEIASGVYVRCSFRGEVYKVSENKANEIDTDLQSDIDLILKDYIYSTDSSWQKQGKYFYFTGSKNEEDNMLCVDKDILTINRFIHIVFSPSIVNGTWFDKIIKIYMQIEVCDYKDEEANMWRAM